MPFKLCRYFDYLGACCLSPPITTMRQDLLDWLPQIINRPFEFQREPGSYPEDLVSSSAIALLADWNGQMRALDHISPRWSLTMISAAL